MTTRSTISQYDLGELLSEEPVSEGNAPCFAVETSLGTYFVKSMARDQAATPALLFAVGQTLCELGVRQPRLHRTRSGGLVSSDGYALFDYLPGRSQQMLSDRQFENHVAHLATYNDALTRVPLVPATATIRDLTALTNHYRKATSIDYLVETFQPELHSLHLSESVRRVSVEALAILTDLRPSYEQLPKQLIHADIGPGNILFEGDDVVAFIDLTPEYGSHLYSLCMSLFWHCLYYTDKSPDVERIIRGLQLYANLRPLTPMDHNCVFPLLVKAVAFRLFSRLIANQQHPTFLPQSIDTIAQLMRALLEAREEIEHR